MVSEDKSIVFRYGHKTYGPYTAKEHPTAIPKEQRNVRIYDRFGAVFICILNAISILFADELFRWNLAFQIRNVDNAEPSDWEIAGRYIGWTVMTIMALVIFITGLQ